MPLSICPVTSAGSCGSCCAKVGEGSTANAATSDKAQTGKRRRENPDRDDENSDDMAILQSR